MKLPRNVAKDSKIRDLVMGSGANTMTLWSGGGVQVSCHSLASELIRCLSYLKKKGAITVGMDKIKDSLKGVEKGDVYTYALLMTDGGSERLYRGAEGLAIRHSVIPLRLSCAPAELGQALFQKDKEIKAIMISGEEACGELLASLVQS